MKVYNLVQTCLACPSQWEFETDNNRMAYVRYRFGHLSIRISKPYGTISDAVVGKEVYEEDIGTPWDGFIDWEDIEPKIKRIKIRDKI